jgi:DNA-binding NarL/FixJ family response regulator
MLSLEGLVEATMGDPARAARLAEDAKSLSCGVDSVFLSRFATLLGAHRQGMDDDTFKDAAVDLVRACENAEAYEALVLAGRANGDWLAAIAEDADAASIVTRTLVRVGETGLAHRAGLAFADGGYESLLTAREQEVLRQMAKGLSNKAIGKELFISESTVKAHVRHILEKLNVRTRLQAVLRAAAMREGKD